MFLAIKSVSHNCGSGYDMTVLEKEMSTLEKKTATFALPSEINFDYEAEDGQ